MNASQKACRCSVSSVFRACFLPIPLLYFKPAMTAYHFTHSMKSPLSSTDVQEKKAARKKLLDEVEKRRRDIYTQHYKKMQLQADCDLL